MNAAPQPTPERLWTARDVAEFFGCSQSAVYKWCERGAKRGDAYGPKLPSIKLGALVRFKPDVVRAWAEGTVTPEPAAQVVPLHSRTRP
jgi:predicted DNA-binding transcriptional regulator AlpA